MSSSQSTTRWGDFAGEAIACESVSELLRAKVVADYEESGLTLQQWFTEVRNGTRFGPGDHREFPSFSGMLAWVDRVAPPGDGGLWVEIVCSTIEGVARSNQRVRQRIRFGNSNLMDYALLSKNTNCLFCHLRIKGDMGTLADLNLGKGTVNSSSGNIEGNIFTAGDAMMGSGAQSGTLNGTTFTGALNEYSHGPKLPVDTSGDGVPDFPFLDPDVVAAATAGRIWAGNSTNNAADG